MLYVVDIYDEWHNIVYMKHFNTLEQAILSGERVLEQDETEQLCGFSIFDLNTGLIVVNKYHGKKLERIEKNEAARFELEITRFELMEI
jgi:hypothetical protein